MGLTSAEADMEESWSEFSPPVNGARDPVDSGPLALDALLRGAGPIEIDIGFGRGRSLVERAQIVPGVRLLGIEQKRSLAAKVSERCARLGLTNVHVMAGDVREILPRLSPDGSVQRVFVHFPDPWWKKRHQKRRVVERGLLDQVARLLVPGGELFIQTDVHDRAMDYVQLIAGHPAFGVAGERGFVSDNPFGARSNREVCAPTRTDSPSGASWARKKV